jgi:hypothetical protein
MKRKETSNKEKKSPMPKKPVNPSYEEKMRPKKPDSTEKNKYGTKRDK